MSSVERSYAAGDRKIACLLYDRHICDQLRSTEYIRTIRCVHRTDVVRLVAISGMSVANWSHKCDQKYNSYDLFAFTCDNMSQPSVTYRNPP